MVKNVSCVPALYGTLVSEDDTDVTFFAVWAMLTFGIRTSMNRSNSRIVEWGYAAYFQMNL